MRQWWKLIGLVLVVGMLVSCGDGEPKDKGGQKLKAGQAYLVTKDGFEPIPHLSDTEGKKLQIGNEYMMTRGGMKLIMTRNIRGQIQDPNGRPVPDMNVFVAGTEHHTTTDRKGRFELPFVDGPVTLMYDSPHLPHWCKGDNAIHANLGRSSHPDGWDVGVVKLHCLYLGTHDGHHRWATADGRFVYSGAGTLSDTVAGISWLAQVERNPASWQTAKEYCEGLEVGGHHDWRLPTLDELSTLYEANVACGWTGPEMISDAMVLWTAVGAGPDKVHVYNVCTGHATVESTKGRAAGPQPGALAVRGKAAAGAHVAEPAAHGEETHGEVSHEQPAVHGEEAHGEAMHAEAAHETAHEAEYAEEATHGETHPEPAEHGEASHDEEAHAGHGETAHN